MWTSSSCSAVPYHRAPAARTGSVGAGCTCWRFYGSACRCDSLPALYFLLLVQLPATWCFSGCCRVVPEIEERSGRRLLLQELDRGSSHTRPGSVPERESRKRRASSWCPPWSCVGRGAVLSLIWPFVVITPVGGVSEKTSDRGGSRLGTSAGWRSSSIAGVLVWSGRVSSHPPSYFVARIRRARCADRGRRYWPVLWCARRLPKTVLRGSRASGHCSWWSWWVSITPIDLSDPFPLERGSDDLRPRRRRGAECRGVHRAGPATGILHRRPLMLVGVGFVRRLDPLATCRSLRRRGPVRGRLAGRRSPRGGRRTHRILRPAVVVILVEQPVPVFAKPRPREARGGWSRPGP